MNGKVLTYSATAKTYKVWDLVNYTLRYALSDEGIQETKISPGVMLLVYNRAASGSHIPLKLVAIDSGRVLKSFNHLLVRQKRVEFIGASGAVPDAPLFACISPCFPPCLQSCSTRRCL